MQPLPQDGDRVLWCAHALASDSLHYYSSEAGWDVIKPDGEHFVAHWVLVCDACFMLPNITDQINGDGIWQGHSPKLLRGAIPS